MTARRARATSEDERGVRRAAWIGLSTGALTILLLARSLSPDPSGMGTHTQLGLPPCFWLAFTGLPCPACGLTTSFAYAARWQWGPAFAAHPLGPAGWWLVVALALFGGAAAAGWDAPARFVRRGLLARRTWVGLCMALLVVWCLRLVGLGS